MVAGGDSPLSPAASPSPGARRSVLRIFRGLAPLAPAESRSALVASIYVVSYLAFSVPAVIAGVAVDRYGLPDATYGYGAVVILLAAATAVAVWRGGPPSRLSPRAAR